MKVKRKYCTKIENPWLRYIFPILLHCFNNNLYKTSTKWLLLAIILHYDLKIAENLKLYADSVQVFRHDTKDIFTKCARLTSAFEDLYFEERSSTSCCWVKLSHRTLVDRSRNCEKKTRCRKCNYNETPPIPTHIINDSLHLSFIRLISFWACCKQLLNLLWRSFAWFVHLLKIEITSKFISNFISKQC